MNEIEHMGLSSDEKRCLRMWFRQAISIVEREEAKRALLAEDAACNPNAPRSPHPKFAGRRVRRSRLSELVGQLV